LNGSFHADRAFDFSEIEGTIGKGYRNRNGSYSKSLAVSKGCRGSSIFNTLLKHDL
jgi:hypothetical protein